MEIDNKYYLLARLNEIHGSPEFLTGTDILNICLYLGIENNRSRSNIASEIRRQNIIIANILETERDFEANKDFQKSKFIRDIVLLNKR